MINFQHRNRKDKSQLLADLIQTYLACKNMRKLKVSKTKVH